MLLKIGSVMIKYQIFGSVSSIDYDVLVFVDSLGTIQENHDTVHRFNDELDKLFADMGMPAKKMNANLGVLEDGMVVKVFKGYPFEVNNSLFTTYGNHRQTVENQVTREYELTDDIKHYKLKRCFRFLLSFYSRVPEWRTDIKSALRGNLVERTDCVEKINLFTHTEFPGKNESVTDIYKTFAFQLAQTYMLIRDTEVYSKEDVIKHLPRLESSLMRKGTGIAEMSMMHGLLNSLIEYSRTEMKKMKSLDEEITS